MMSSLAVKREGIDLLIKVGADPDVKKYRGQTSLHYAVTDLTV
ncbi:MAG: hypothetical protein ACR5K2_05285 [Wolbachia sp.]